MLHRRTLLSCLLALSGTAFAQGFPTKPITFVVPTRRVAWSTPRHAW